MNSMAFVEATWLRWQTLSALLGMHLHRNTIFHHTSAQLTEIFAPALTLGAWKQYGRCYCISFNPCNMFLGRVIPALLPSKTLSCEETPPQSCWECYLSARLAFLQKKYQNGNRKSSEQTSRKSSSLSRNTQSSDKGETSVKKGSLRNTWG